MSERKKNSKATLFRFPRLNKQEMILIPFIGEDDEETEKRERKFTFEGIYKWLSARGKNGFGN
jgi:hypothetical protein